MIRPAAVALSYPTMFPWIERRQAPELKLGSWVGEFAAGIALFSSAMALLWALGRVSLHGMGHIYRAWGGHTFALSAAVLEEILFRRYRFRMLSRAAGTWAAVVVTSLLFGAAHAANPGATFLSSFANAIEAAVILAAAYAMTGRLWMPVGLHLGWNFSESTI